MASLDAVEETKKNNEIIGLNVGGKIFRTTRQTLANIRDGFLHKLVTNKFDSLKDENGNYFIDRDSEYFSIILDYHRFGDKIKEKINTNIFRAINIELDFYLLPTFREPDNKINFSKILDTSERILIFNYKTDKYKRVENFFLLNSLIIQFDIEGEIRLNGKNKEVIRDPQVKLSMYKNNKWIELIAVKKLRYELGTIPLMQIYYELLNSAKYEILLELRNLLKKNLEAC